MKNIILAVTVTLAIFASTGAFARGFSVGVLGSYGIDNGAIERSGNAAVLMYMDDSGNLDYDPMEVAGAVFFMRYDFKNNLFIRSGAEINFLAEGGEVKYNDNSDPLNIRNDKKRIEYEALTIPVYFGITLSPDRGKTNVYAGAGAFFSIIEIEREYSIFETQAGSTHNDYKTYAKNELFTIGYTGIIGLERNIFSNFYLVIEFAFYTGDITKKEDGEGTFWTLNGSPLGGITQPYQYTERYGLPSQQLRLGLRYEF